MWCTGRLLRSLSGGVAGAGLADGAPLAWREAVSGSHAADREEGGAGASRRWIYFEAPSLGGPPRCHPATCGAKARAEICAPIAGRELIEALGDCPAGKDAQEMYTMVRIRGERDFRGTLRWGENGKADQSTGENSGGSRSRARWTCCDPSRAF